MDKGRAREIKREADRILFSDGGKQWPIFRVRDKLWEDFWLFFDRYIAATAKLAPPSNAKSGRLNLPEYHPRHKNPIVYDNAVQEIFDASGKARKDRVDVVRNALEVFLQFHQNQSFSKLETLRKRQKELPMKSYEEEICEAVAQSRVTIVAGDTGCGKSTQVPQYLLKHGFRKIAVTQPRRIASIALAKRVGYETLNMFGSHVGYKVRFDGTATKATRIIFLTEGLLLRQMQMDTLLKEYDVIILDEVHERHLQSDLLLGLLAEVIMKRDDLRLVLMSATINIELFSKYFEGCPIIQVPGRLFPITLQFRPPGNENQFSKENSTNKRINPMPVLRTLQLIDSKYKSSDRGDLLVFLSGMSEIQTRTVLEPLQNYAEESKKWIILALHSSLSVAEQDKVFDLPPEGCRKCILSTNIAETSVTIDGIRFVIDTGKMKEMSFEAETRMRKLREYWVSKASAEQRKGRAGRTGPGICFRLYSEDDFDALSDYSSPEIQRVPLDQLILQMKQMKIGDPRTFNFIEKPPEENLEISFKMLKGHLALDSDEKLTPLGECLAQLPVDVVIGKMLIMGTLFDLIEPILTLAACLSVQNPLTRHAFGNEDAVSRLKELESDIGDPMQLLYIFDSWIEIKNDKKYSTKKWCQRRGIEEQRMYEIANLRKQFKSILSGHALLNNETARLAELEAMDSKERKLRHGQMKMLKALKRSANEEQKKQKRLKHNDGTRMEMALPDEDELEAEEAAKIDITDLEFRLKHDVQSITDHSAAHLSQKDIQMLQILICAGLYPQVAIQDKNNTYSAEQEQMFHTRDKNFLTLHPTGYFANNPKSLEPNGKEEPDPLQPEKKRLVSHRHQLLAFHSLLETSKPYLMMPIRVPALHSVLLYSSELDTSGSCQTIVADRWLEFRIHQEGAGWDIIEDTISIRKEIESVLIARLVDRDVSEKGALEKKMLSFVNKKVRYSVRKLGPAERTELYVGPGENNTMSEDFGVDLSDAQPHPEKGGIVLASFLTFNSLSLSEDGQDDIYISSLRTFWTCDICELHLPLTFQERTMHRKDCEEKQRAQEAAQVAAMEEKLKVGEEEHKKGSSQFYCEICGQIFYFTPIQILKHKKTCAEQQQL